jgi:hypothetical protein
MRGRRGRLVSSASLACVGVARGGIWSSYVDGKVGWDGVKAEGGWIGEQYLPGCYAGNGGESTEEIWTTGQITHGPPSPEEQPNWLSDVRAWRDECRRKIGIDDQIHETAHLKWTQSAFVQVQAHPYDLGFYDPAAGEYTIDSWLDDLDDRFGGIDAVLLWCTYTNVGIDARNSYDLTRLLPGNMSMGDRLVEQLHARGVHVLWPYMVWDKGTRDEGLPDHLAMARLQNLSGADGFNGDTLWHIDRELFEASLAGGKAAAIQPEWGGDIGTLRYSTMGWGEAGGWTSTDLSIAPPYVSVHRDHD